MSAERPDWHYHVAGEMPPEQVQTIVALVEDLMTEPADQVVRSYASDLILKVRALRDETRLVQAECDASARQSIVFQRVTHDGVQDVTLEEYVTRTLEGLVELKSLLHDLQFYAMALEAQRRQETSEL